jgi:hypothetical protein
LELGVLDVRKSEDATKAATTKQMVVKKPKTFWARFRAECILAWWPLSQEVGFGIGAMDSM